MCIAVQVADELRAVNPARRIPAIGRPVAVGQNLGFQSMFPFCHCGQITTVSRKATHQARGSIDSVQSIDSVLCVEFGTRGVSIAVR
jgi:hypothetical protein